AMCDENIIVRGQGAIYLGGPPLVRAATGEQVTAEELGGGEVHTRISGVSDHLASDDAHGLALAREALAQVPPVRPSVEPEPVEPPAEDPADLYGVLPRDPRRPYEVRALLARLVDGARLRDRAGAEADGHDRRLARRRELRHVRPLLRAPLPLQLAERAHLGDGWRTGGDDAARRQARAAPRAGEDAHARGGGGAHGAHPRQVRG